MSKITQTRVSARALTGAALTGSAVGLVLGAAYLASGLGHAAAQYQRVSRLAGAAAQGFSEEALLSTADGMSPGVLAVARRHDPFSMAGGAQRDRQSAVLAARLEKSSRKNALTTEGLLLRASYGGPLQAAAPFQLGGALDASRDLECLTQAVYYEARGETPAGQAAVAQVVLNRVRHPAFPKSVCAVVYQGAYGRGACQFSFACDGSMRKRREPRAWARAEKVASRALSGAVAANVGNATHFHTVNVAPAWGSQLMRVGQVGLHVFYKFGGRHGRPSAFTGKPERSLEELPRRDDNAPVLASLVPAAPSAPEPAAHGAGTIYLAKAVVDAKAEAAADEAVATAMTAPAKAAASKPAALKPVAPKGAQTAQAAPSADGAAKPASAELKVSETFPVRTSKPTSGAAS